MKRKIVIFAGLVLMVSALIAMPVSAGNGQSGSVANGQLMSQNCVANTGDITQGSEYCYQNSEGYCYLNSECTGVCPNDGVRPLDGTGFKYSRGNGLRNGNNAAGCPLL